MCCSVPEKTVDTQYTRDGLDRALRRALTSYPAPAECLMRGICEACTGWAKQRSSWASQGVQYNCAHNSTSMLLETLLGAVGTGQTFNTRGRVGANGRRRGDGGGIVAGVRSGGGGEQALGLVATTRGSVSANSDAIG